MRNHVRRFDDGGSIWGSDDSDGLSVNVDSDSPENNPYVGTTPTGDELNPYRQPVDRTDELNPYVQPKTEPVEDELNPYRQPPGVGGGGGGGGGGETPQTPAPTIPDELKNLLKGLIVGDDGKPNPMGLFGIMSLLSMMRGSNAPAQVGYQGKVPKFAAVRERVPITEDPNRRPGAGGRRYFSDTTYVPQDRAATAADANAAAKAAAVTAAKTQAAGLKQAPYTAPVTAKPEEKTGGIGSLIKEAKSIGGGSKVADLIKVPEYNTRGEIVQPMGPPAPEKKQGSISDLMDRVKAANPQLDWSKYNPDKMTMDYDEFDQARDAFLRNVLGAGSFVQQAAQGGLMNLAKGRYLNGATDGMADKIPANIEGTQPAALSHGEFVIPADVVSHLGNGNSESGAQRLYDMMDRIRKARTGSPKQGKQINPDKFLPR